MDVLCVDKQKPEGILMSVEYYGGRVDEISRYSKIQFFFSFYFGKEELISNVNY